MKKIIVCFLIFCKIMAFAEENVPNYSSPSFPIEFSGYFENKDTGEYKRGYIKLSNDVMEIKNEIYSTATETYSIKWSTEDKIDYITFYYNGKNLGNNIKHGEKKYLVLFSMQKDDMIAEDGYYYYFLHTGYFLAFYEKNNLVFHFFGGRYDWIYEDIKIKTSSEKTEKNIVYKAKNLLDFSILLPWVEGTNGNGIGETIELSSIYSSGILVISNGYVDYDRPYLYGYNNRVKKIKIYDIGNENDYKIINIEDKPGFQIFDKNEYFPDKYIRELSEYISPDINLVFKIIEIYPGTRYNDTCINYLQIHYGP